MAIIKCKMCGGDLEVVAESRVAVCEYCGTQQTVPSADNEKKLTLFGRANRLRMACEFDKAAGVYESIVADFPEEAEAYWGLVLCKYGIEYVDDPATGKKIPTCHRSSFDSVMDDSNLEQALENADALARRVYRDEAKAIEELRKGIIEVSGKEEPYDIFICYKETDDNGDRTIDSVIAQEVYDALTEKGYRVFFSRITLEDKLGQEYEPYIFAALHSAKIMLAFGTDYEYYNAVWVKNEWSRFLQLIAAGEKKTLIPCYKNIDAYDMPKEFARLQAQDMGKVGAMQDLLRGIEKILPREKQVVKETAVVQQSGGNNKVQALLDRGNMALEDGEWAKADGFFEEVLNNDAKCAWAYVGKTLAQERCKSLDAFVEKRIAIGSEVKAEKVTIPADEAHIQEMVDKLVVKNYLSEGEIRELYTYLACEVSVSSYEENCKQAEIYWNNQKMLNRAESFAIGETAERLRAAKACLLSTLRENACRAKKEEEARQASQESYAAFLADADEKAFLLNKEAKERLEADYLHLKREVNEAKDVYTLERVLCKLSDLEAHSGSQELMELCCEHIDEIKKRERQMEEEEKRRVVKKNSRKDLLLATALFIPVMIVITIYVLIPQYKYNQATKLLDSGNYAEALLILEELDGVKNSADIAKSIYMDYSTELIKGAKQGEEIVFGLYEQDDLISDGKDLIEWIVLEKKDDMLFVISKYILEALPYQYEGWEAGTWEDCTLRKWLNEDFFNGAFSDAEKAKIVTTTVSADDNPEYGTDAGNETQDKVFLLSIEEANKYFDSDKARKGEVTEFSHRVANASSRGICGYWLRSPGEDQSLAARVDRDGNIYEIGIVAGDPMEGVRPAMWISLED